MGAKSKKRVNQLKEMRKKRWEQSAVETDMEVKVTSDPGSSSSGAQGASKPLKETASAKKLSYFSGYHADSSPSSEANTESFGIISFASLDTLFQNIPCPNCGLPNLSCVDIAERSVGLARCLQVICKSCSATINEEMSSSKLPTKDGRTYTVNRLATVGFIESGSGYAGMCKTLSALNCHVPSQSMFTGHLSSFNVACLEECNNEMSQAGEIVRNVYLELNPNLAENDTINISVTYDGTWHTRGRSSHHGVGMVIDCLTGLVLDYHICCTYCAICSLIQASDKDKDEKLKKLKEHRDSQKCSINFTGSAGAMEIEHAKVMWGRSINRHNLRYTTLIGDGDAKTMANLGQPYGPDFPVVKEECINHVGKRMGTALRKLVSMTKKDEGTSLGGRGKLSGPVIEKLTNYYSKAIRDNTDNLENMQNAVFSTLLHVTSTDKNPRHHKCPTGEDSRCFYNKALAHNEKPGKHNNKDNMSIQVGEELAKKMFPIYQRLGDKNLLKRCLQGKTQNQNESIHSVVWGYVGKSKFVGLKTIEIATARSVCKFNSGARSLTATLRLMNIELSASSKKFLHVQDLKRKSKSKVASSYAKKQLRKRRKVERLKNIDEIEKKEGKLYSPGDG